MDRPSFRDAQVSIQPMMKQISNREDAPIARVRLRWEWTSPLDDLDPETVFTSAVSLLHEARTQLFQQNGALEDTANFGLSLETSVQRRTYTREPAAIVEIGFYWLMGSIDLLRPFVRVTDSSWLAISYEEL